jgi:demethylmenaquinone methyltransferase/2-methoxy-6-polyprenyl-1,4-benzoquinol methylase
MGTTVKPYQSGKSKKEEVEQMFDNIAFRYDFLNHFLSFGIDRRWRKKAIRLLKKHHPNHILDVATGTGDLAIKALRLNDTVKITGIDISAGMLAKGNEKLKAKKLEGRINLLQADSENIPFTNENFDAVMVAFGVRNFENLAKGLQEMHRVIKKGSPAVILEFSKPTKWPIKHLYKFYCKRIMSSVGKRISKDPAAYAYLPESVAAFPEGNEFKDIMKQCGFNNVKAFRLSGGIATIYTGLK